MSHTRKQPLILLSGLTADVNEYSQATSFDFLLNDVRTPQKFAYCLVGLFCTSVRKI